MQVITFVSILFLTSSGGYTSDLLTQAKRDSILDMVVWETDMMLKTLYGKPGYTALMVDWEVETYIIDSFMIRAMEVDPTTYGMVSLTEEAAEAYDSLSNKYLLYIKKKLESREDSLILEESCRAWANYIEAEKKLIWLMAEEKYSGGGTIQNIIISSRILGLSMSRAETIFDYASEMMRME
ncbi:hypothetical protein JXA84_08120 [candidate division WOR-3 bacterium]|nr:hypothetical protein [candidate division WOR-3 bacterium]